MSFKSSQYLFLTTIKLFHKLLMISYLDVHILANCDAKILQQCIFYFRSCMIFI